MKILFLVVQLNTLYALNHLQRRCSIASGDKYNPEVFIIHVRCIGVTTLVRNKNSNTQGRSLNVVKVITDSQEWPWKR